MNPMQKRVFITVLGVSLWLLSPLAPSFGDEKAVAATATGSPAGSGKPKLDRGKGTIELPAKSVITAAGGSSVAAPIHTRPPVPPGLVKWHGTFDAACTAAKTSGKPVLLFHMMGRLDEEFC
jgi:hypothetical protein